MSQGELRVGHSEVRIEIDRSLVQLNRYSIILGASDPIVVLVAAQIVVIRLQVVGRYRIQRLPLSLEERDLEGTCHLFRDVPLDLKHTGQNRIVTLSP